MATLKEQSKKTWTGNETLEHINAGSLQRIADSLEKMEQPFKDLLEAVDRGRRDIEYFKEELNYYKRSDAALRGIVKNLKKRREDKNGKQSGT